ncbi:MAG: hypothetical protein KAU07_00600 [Candidatus Andersenbacteria bacterium]|nr:hypothetical protein [Candidatus Andersenbacteria bacterium]
MDNKFRCTVCGAILLAVGATEASNLIYGYCSHCNHLHTVEKNFQNDMPKIDRMISSISAPPSPSAAITDFE